MHRATLLSLKAVEIYKNDVCQKLGLTVVESLEMFKKFLAGSAYGKNFGVQDF
jgi:hypothetical protein